MILVRCIDDSPVEGGQRREHKALTLFREYEAVEVFNRFGEFYRVTNDLGEKDAGYHKRRFRKVLPH